ncbi:MAG: hypothetical protein GY851_21345, partial [bacterium]|nr:hypothetical protein [bacterium]
MGDRHGGCGGTLHGGVTPALAAVWTVDDDLQDLATADYQYVQSAIDAASSGDEIVIYPGHYYEQLVINDWSANPVKDLVLTSTDPEDDSVVAATIIDASVSGAGADRVIRMCGYETADTRIEGLTLQNGYTSANHGGGILGGYQNTPRAAAVVSRCVIKDCTASGCDGGGLACLNGRIEYCTLADNAASNGGAIAFCGDSTAYADTVIKGNVIEYNSSTALGGGIYYCYAIIEDNDIH